MQFICDFSGWIFFRQNKIQYFLSGWRKWSHIFLKWKIKFYKTEVAVYRKVEEKVSLSEDCSYSECRIDMRHRYLKWFFSAFWMKQMHAPSFWIYFMEWTAVKRARVSSCWASSYSIAWHLYAYLRIMGWNLQIICSCADVSPFFCLL